tara:strand:- start:1919 stop:2077 length:159 start_codon:yes stop_codon:yes gene_type:complete
MEAKSFQHGKISVIPGIYTFATAKVYNAPRDLYPVSSILAKALFITTVKPTN